MLTLSPVRFFLSVTALFVAIGAPPLSAEVITKTGRFNGAQVSYRVILPDGYDASKEYPGILAFPGGGQGLGLVDGMIAQNLREQSESRGYITVVPAAPTQGLFFQGGDVIFPAFLDTILRDYKGKIVLVVTLPEVMPLLIRGLQGSKRVPPIADDEHDNLYIVSIPWYGKVKTLRLRYGLPPSSLFYQ